jgi:hypothetical protein
MADNCPGIAPEQRTALLRHGVVVLDSELDGPCPRIVVTGAGAARVQTLVAQHLGVEVDVEVWSDLPRELRPLRCVGYMEREAGRLQVRFVLRGDEHVDDIVVAEDDAEVVVFATVCTAVAGDGGNAWEGPWHVYLDRPLGDRTVVDGSSGASVPFVNVYDLGAQRSEPDRRVILARDLCHIELAQRSAGSVEAAAACRSDEHVGKRDRDASERLVRGAHQRFLCSLVSRASRSSRCATSTLASTTITPASRRGVARHSQARSRP